MVFSLQKRFLLFLLLPVAFIVGLLGFGGFLMASWYLSEQWAQSVQLKLDKAAHQITMKLDDVLQIITLIAKAEDAPRGDLIQAYLIQQLVEKEGVRFVDLETIDLNQKDPGSSNIDANDYGSGMVDGLYTTELCGDFGFCAPITDPGALDKSLRIVKILTPQEKKPIKRLIVRMSFDSLLIPIREMGLWQGSIPLLVTSTGQFLAADHKAYADRKRLADNGDELEKELLRQVRTKEFGTVVGRGRPPEIVVGFYKIPSINWYVILVSKGSAIMEPLIRFRLYSLIAGLAALAIVLLLIRLTTRSVGRSIGAISEAAAKVTDGDYSPVLPEHRSDEIGELNRNFNRMVKGLKQRDLIKDTFGRYVDKAVAEELMSRPEALRLGGEKAVVTILMSDLRDFTPMSEKLPPEQVIKLLNRYFGRMIAVIELYRGIIVDFYGDSILVFFNGEDSQVSQRALDAVRCALEMQSALVAFMEENKDKNIPRLCMGIGVHTGEVVVGNIGTETRAKYGIVGAAVNMTDRIQSTASPGKVVISEETYQTISKWLNISHDFRVCLKGIEDQKKLYEVESLSNIHDHV